MLGSTRGRHLLVACALLGPVACTTAPDTSNAGGGDLSHPESRRLRPAFGTADSLRNAMSLAAALEEYARLEVSMRREGDTAGIWRAHWGRADVVQRMGHLDRALAIADSALVRAHGDDRREGWVRSTMSFIAWRQGRMDESLQLAEQMLNAAMTSGDLALELTAYHQFGRTYSLMGRHRDALAAHEQALELLRTHNAESRRAAQLLNEIGIDYRRLGRYDDARRAYEEGLAAFREAGDNLWIAITLYNLSNVLRSIGDRDGAYQALIESLDRNRTMESPRGLAFVHGGLASLHLEIGNTALARRHLDSATVWNREAQHPLGVAGTHEDRARLEIAEGNVQLADSLLALAIAIADSGDFVSRSASARDALARLRLEQGRAGDAVTVASRAWAIADATDDPAIEIQTLETLARAHEARGDTVRALETNDLAIERLESWRTQLALGDQRRGIWDPRLGPYENAIRLRVAAGDHVGSLELAERTRARLLLDLMALDPERADADTVIGNLRRRLEETFAGRAHLTGEAWEHADAAMAAMRDTLNRLEAAARDREPVVAAARYPDPAGMETLQRVLVGPDRTVLTYFWGEHDVYGWRISTAGVHSARLGDPHRLEALIDFLRETAFRADTSDLWRNAARRAFEVFVQPLAPIAADQLLIVPAGPLNALPFEILLSASGAPLGVTTAVAYGPSASVLATLAATPLRRSWSRGVLAVGNPRPARLPRAGDTRRSDALGPLPFAADEARTIAALVDSASVALVGRGATITEWQNHAPGEHRFLHFGAHAVIDDRRIDKTHIQLANGPLELSEIRRTPLNAELVTLSACESGLGRDVGGEGIVGLSHAFLAAGARGTLVTLWRVPDRLARDFSVAFYEQLIAGQTPIAALHTVKREWIAAGRHPSEWSGFVLVGGI